MTDLHEAIRANDLSAAEELLRAGADPNGEDAPAIRRWASRPGLAGPR